VLLLAIASLVIYNANDTRLRSARQRCGTDDKIARSWL